MRKQISLFSFDPKTEQKYFLISALASKKRSDQKNKGTLYHLGLFNIIINYIIKFFDLNSFERLGQKSKNIFVRFLVQMRTRKFAFEINWHLITVGRVKKKIIFVGKKKTGRLEIFWKLISGYTWDQQYSESIIEYKTAIFVYKHLSRMQSIWLFQLIKQNM